VDPATAAYYGELTLGAVVNAADIIAGRKPADSLAVDAVNDLTLQITLSHPVPYFLKLLTHPCTFPVHRASVEQYGDRHAQPGNLVTNGAYRLVDWKIGSYIELVRNEHYRNNAQTAIDRVRHHVTSDSLAELNRYRAGELHITASIPAESFQQMLRERPDEVRVSPYNAVYYYGLNMTRPPFKDNPKLRQALSMAIDRETITEKVIGRGEMPAYSWVPPGVSNYDPQQLRYAGMSRQEQIARARELYSEAGYGPDNPLRIELRHITADSHKRIAEAVQFMWQEALGVETTTIIEEFQVLLEHMRKKEITQVFVSGWTGDYDDANAFLEILQSRNLSNMSGYSNPEYDRQMQRAAKQTDMRVRQGYLEEAEAILLDDHPIIPIYFLVNKNMVSPRVRGWQDNILNYHYSQYLSLADSN
jgi:oligopeptide transport system substrate-binding protein